MYFYPRSPCGERHLQRLPCVANSCISIHALLAESDLIDLVDSPVAKEFLSTLSLRRATYPSDQPVMYWRISIHALLAESDGQADFVGYLRSSISIHALLAESDALLP